MTVSEQVPISLTSTDPRTIAMDGPARSGKGTLASRLAGHFDLLHLNSGLIYRAITLHALDNGVSITTASALAQSATLITTEMIMGKAGDLYSPRVNGSVAVVSQHASVREIANSIQHRMITEARGRVVVEGRDIAIKVLPNALVKLYVTASVMERARREYALTGGEARSLKMIYDEIEGRDCADQTREVDPLVKHPDAFVVDTTALGPDEVFDYTLRYIGSRFSNF